MTAQVESFDPAHYKATTREQWERSAQAWSDWTPTIEAWLGSATERMLDLVGIGEGCRVLDVAAGAGQPAIRNAHRTGPGGRVVATDISPEILHYAAILKKLGGERSRHSPWSMGVKGHKELPASGHRMRPPAVIEDAHYWPSDLPIHERVRAGRAAASVASGSC